MKVLETILRVLARLLNVPLFVLNVVLIILYMTIIVVIIIPLEFILVPLPFYVATGKSYYYWSSLKDPYRRWFPISKNLEFYLNKFPFFIIDEDLIDFSKYYDRDKEHTSL